jgi:hypothetical protein
METIARTWAEVQEWLFLDSWNPSLQRFRSTFVYRGSSRAGFGIHTSISRLGGDYAAKEQHITRNFRKYAAGSLGSDDSIWNWLALAKHHGLPTRLLDWSYSPYIALHFATALLESFDTDGEILAVNIADAHTLLPKKLRSVLDEEGSYVFTGEMLDPIASSLRVLDDLAKEPFLLFLEPPSLDQRIVNQAALFSLMSSARASFEGWLQANPGLHRTLIVPAELKWEVRDKLDQANINERVLFPGLDGLSAWLRRYYAERAPAERGVEDSL